MSYDLTFIRVPAGMPPSLAYDAWAEAEEERVVNEDVLERFVSDGVRAQMRTIADALKTWRPELDEFIPEKPLPWIELNDEALMVQFSITEDSVSATMPYYGKEPKPMMECLTGSISVLAAAGYTAYDPQLGRVVTAADLDKMIAIYGAVPSPAELLRDLDRVKKPWWKFW